jgi:hypothetical protein
MLTKESNAFTLLLCSLLARPGIYLVKWRIDDARNRAVGMNMPIRKNHFLGIEQFAWITVTIYRWISLPRTMQHTNLLMPSRASAGFEGDWRMH